MRAITIRFNVECPHCGQMGTVETLSTGEIDGALLEECKKCHQQYAIGWSIEVGVDVYKCDSDPANVQCTYALSESWDPDDPEEDAP